jgi:hypothetical protein
MRIFAILVVTFLAAVVLISNLSGPPKGNPTDSPQVRESAGAIISRAQLVLADWETFSKKKAEQAPTTERTELALNALALVKPEEPEHQAAAEVAGKLQAISKKFGKEALSAEAAALGRKLLEQRKSYAATLEDAYLRKGQDFKIRTEGKDATTLRIQWVLIGRPFVYNAINDRELMLRWKLMGFRTIVFSDGYNNTWRQKIE